MKTRRKNRSRRNKTRKLRGRGDKSKKVKDIVKIFNNIRMYFLVVTLDF